MFLTESDAVLSGFKGVRFADIASLKDSKNVPRESGHLIYS